MVIDKKTSTLALVSVITIITIVSGLLLVGQMVNASDIDENTTNSLNSENELNIEPIQSNENSGDIQGFEFGLPKKDCIDLVGDILDIIIEGLQISGKVKIHNFGTFSIKNKKSRIGRNPKTKEEVMIGERKVVSFKASKNVLKYLNSFNA